MKRFNSIALSAGVVRVVVVCAILFWLFFVLVQDRGADLVTILDGLGRLFKSASAR